MLNFKVLLCCLVISFGAMTANAQGHGDLYNYDQDQVLKQVSWQASVGPGATRSLSLGSWMYVSKVIVQAEGIGRDGQLEVYANGQNVGTIYAPGRDPSYVVTVKESVNSLEFRHVMGASVKVRRVTVYGRRLHSPSHVYPMKHGFSGIGHYSSAPMSGSGFDCRVCNQATSIAMEAISIIEALDRHTRWADYGAYLLPIKKVAARLYASAKARGDLSKSVHGNLVALAIQIDAANQFMDFELERDAVFQLTIKLMSLRDRIYTITR